MSYEYSEDAPVETTTQQILEEFGWEIAKWKAQGRAKRKSAPKSATAPGAKPLQAIKADKFLILCYQLIS